MLRLGLTAQIFYSFLCCVVLAETDVLSTLTADYQLRPPLVTKVYMKKDPATQTWTFQDDDFADQVMASHYTPSSQFQLVKGVNTFPDLSFVGLFLRDSIANFRVSDSTTDPILYVAQGNDVYVHFHGGNETSNFIAEPARRSQPVLAYNVPPNENEFIVEASSGRQTKWAAAIVYQAMAIRTPLPPEQEEELLRSGSDDDVSDNVVNNTKIVISIRTIFPPSSNPNKKRHSWKSEHSLYTSTENWRNISQTIRSTLLFAANLLMLDKEESSLKKEHEMIDAELKIGTGTNSWPPVFMTALVFIFTLIVIWLIWSLPFMVAIWLIANNTVPVLQNLIVKLFQASVIIIMLMSTAIIVLMCKLVLEIVTGIVFQ